jgi:hypothetical protein
MGQLHFKNEFPLAQGSNINNYFSDILKNIACDENVKSYIVSIFAKYKTSRYDLSKDSITVQYSAAKSNNNFEKFQTVADYLFFANSIFPESLNNASKDYYYSIGQLSYFNCYRIIHEWQIYERLADRFVPLSAECRSKLNTQTYAGSHIAPFDL